MGAPHVRHHECATAEVEEQWKVQEQRPGGSAAIGVASAPLRKGWGTPRSQDGHSHGRSVQKPGTDPPGTDPPIAKPFARLRSGAERSKPATETGERPEPNDHTKNRAEESMGRGAPEPGKGQRQRRNKTADEPPAGAPKARTCAAVASWPLLAASARRLGRLALPHCRAPAAVPRRQPRPRPPPAGCGAEDEAAGRTRHTRLQRAPSAGFWSGAGGRSGMQVGWRGSGRPPVVPGHGSCRAGKRRSTGAAQDAGRAAPSEGGGRPPACSALVGAC